LLAAKAKQLDAAQFRMAAASEITKMIGFLIRNELEYAIADRTLGEDEKHVARALNEKFREDLIRRAGGSLQVARQQVAAQGLDFDTVVKEQYKVKLRSVYFMRKEWPKVQVRAEDMRAYYDKHQADQFTERAQAQFRVIKIGFRQTGGRDQAKKKIDDLHRRAVEGEDFAELAGNFNDDPYLMRLHGAVSGEKRLDGSRRVREPEGGRCRLGGQSRAGHGRHRGPGCLFHREARSEKAGARPPVR
jgi:hypothetical protein